MQWGLRILSLCSIQLTTKGQMPPKIAAIFTGPCHITSQAISFGHSPLGLTSIHCLMKLLPQKFLDPIKSYQRSKQANYYKYFIYHDLSPPDLDLLREEIV